MESTESKIDIIKRKKKPLKCRLGLHYYVASYNHIEVGPIKYDAKTRVCLFCDKEQTLTHGNLKGSMKWVTTKS